MFQKNNILFRILSSEVIGKFKLANARSLLQTCRQDIAFGESARETVLCYYDCFFEWVLNTEKLFIAHLNSNGVSNIEELKKQTLDTFMQTLRKIENILDTETDTFSNELAEFVHVVHKRAEARVARAFGIMFNDDTIKHIFASLIELTGDYLQAILVSLHEFDNNCEKERVPFLGFSPWSAKLAIIFKDEGFDPTDSLISRGEYFKQCCGVNEFVIKNYTDTPIEDALFEKMKRHGITAIKEQVK